MLMDVSHNHHVITLVWKWEIMSISLDELLMRPPIVVQMRNIQVKTRRMNTCTQTHRITGSSNIQDTTLRLPRPPSLEACPRPEGSCFHESHRSRELLVARGNRKSGRAIQMQFYSTRSFR